MEGPQHQATLRFTRVPRVSRVYHKFAAYFATQSLHQPSGLMGPSTTIQEDGTNSLQFAQLWLPFGWL